MRLRLQGPRERSKSPFGESTLGGDRVSELIKYQRWTEVERALSNSLPPGSLKQVQISLPSTLTSKAKSKTNQKMSFLTLDGQMSEIYPAWSAPVHKRSDKSNTCDVFNCYTMAAICCNLDQPMGEAVFVYMHMKLT